MEKLIHGHLKIISLVTVKILFIILFVKPATILILNKLKISNKELQNIKQVSKTCITALTKYAQNILDTANKLTHIFKYFHSIMKQTMLLENIKKNNILRWNFQMVILFRICKRIYLT